MNFKAPCLCCHIIGFTPSCLNTVKFSGYKCEYDWLSHEMFSSLSTNPDTCVASEYPNLYTDIKQVAPGLKPMTISYILDLIMLFL